MRASDYEHARPSFVCTSALAVRAQARPRRAQQAWARARHPLGGGGAPRTSAQSAQVGRGALLRGDTWLGNVRGIATLSVSCQAVSSKLAWNCCPSDNVTVNREHPGVDGVFQLNR